MEHTARIALIEQKLKFSSAFTEFLQSMLELLEKTDKYKELNVPIGTTDCLNSFLDIKEVTDYLIYVGFTIESGNISFTYSNDNNNLPMAKKAIQNKMTFIGITPRYRPRSSGAIKKTTVPSANVIRVLKTTNNFLLRMEHMMNYVMRYESGELQKSARDRIPLVMLQVRAMEASRDQQLEIKEGTRDKETPYEMLLLQELVTWFKASFFSWMDKPACKVCHGPTISAGHTQQRINGDSCKVELYKCTKCGTTTPFTRFNDPGILLRTRTGRCGEWANCFALLCRALDYDTRYVADTSDHVWCEVYNAYEQRWIHVDPCEAAIDKPLMYEHGWGKKIEYVMAYSRDDVQDVTWRYSSNHLQVMSRRSKVSESDLREALFTLRKTLQRHLSPGRIAFLQRRVVRELAEMMTERKPSDYEAKGRQSGSQEWRSQRGEIGGKKHSFILATPGLHSIEYYPVLDRYYVDGVDSGRRWRDGVWQCENIRANTEADWKMVYLARSDGAHPGMITWRIEAEIDTKIDRLNVSVVFKEFDSGRVSWSYAIDDGDFKELVFENITSKDLGTATIPGPGRAVRLRCVLSGGGGDISWQQAQLMRTSLQSKQSAMTLTINLSAAD